MNTFCCVWLVFAVVGIKGCVSMYCVQCSSMEDPLCAVGLVVPTKCKQPTKACLTYVGKIPIPGMDVVIRDCATTDMGTFCQNVPGGQDTFNHEFCVHTCYSSSCNNLNMITTPPRREVMEPHVPFLDESENAL